MYSYYRYISDMCRLPRCLALTNNLRAGPRVAQSGLLHYDTTLYAGFDTIISGLCTNSVNFSNTWQVCALLSLSDLGLTARW